MTTDQYIRVGYILDYLRKSNAVNAWSNARANREAIDLYSEFSGDKGVKYGCKSCISKASKWLTAEADKYEAGN